MSDERPLTIALAKGRLQDQALAAFARAGSTIDPAQLASRRLWLDDPGGRYRFVLVKPVDVPVYVQYGTADAGVCGGDVLVESAADVHAPLDLGFGRCRLVVAGRKDDPSGWGSTARVATKYPRTAARWFHERGVPVEVIELSGSVELAPVLGLADQIVDLVESGRTLEENGLSVVETISWCSARLVVNRAAWQLRGPAVRRLVADLRAAVAAPGGAAS